MYERTYWRYYLQLENDFLQILEYVELDTENFSTYSVKLMQLLLSIGSEVDATFKEICQITEKPRPNINDYAPIIFSRYPHIILQTVGIFKRDFVLSPFASWNTEHPASSLPFWLSYNEVKHHRTEKFHEATLKAVVNGLSALFILHIYKMHDLFVDDLSVCESIPDEKSKLFYLKNWTMGIRTSAVNYPYRVIDYDDNSIVI